MQCVSTFERKVLTHLLVLHQSRFPLLKGRSTLHRGRRAAGEGLSRFLSMVPRREPGAVHSVSTHHPCKPNGPCKERLLITIPRAAPGDTSFHSNFCSHVG